MYVKVGTTVLNTTFGDGVTDSDHMTDEESVIDSVTVEERVTKLVMV